MKLKNLFKMLAITLLICLSAQVGSYAMYDPEYDGIEYNAAFDAMTTVIYNKDGILVDAYDGKPFKKRNTWVKFGDGKLKYEDIANNRELKDYYEIEAKFYINWVNANGQIDKSKKYDDVNNRRAYDIMRFIIKKNPANKKDVIVIMKNTNTGEIRKTVVPYGKKKERPLDYGHYVIEKMYQEGIDNKEFEIIPDRPEITLNDHTRTNYDNDIYLTVAENTEYKEEQKKETRGRKKETRRREKETGRRKKESRRKATKRRTIEKRKRRKTKRIRRKTRSTKTSTRTTKSQAKTHHNRCCGRFSYFDSSMFCIV